MTFSRFSGANTVKKIRIYRIIILLFILLAFALRIPILKVRFFDPDEFQHLHSARQIYHGDLPYRDYFDHHTPILHFLMSTFYPIFGENIGILFAARALMMFFTGAILCLVFILVAMLYGIDAGLFGTLFLSYTIMFLEKSIEVRPDLPAVTFWLGAMILMVKGIQRNHDIPLLRWHLFSGLCMGLSIMSTQKASFAFGGMVLALLWTLADGRINRSIGHRVKLVAVFLGGMAIPIGVVCLYFLVNDGLWQFVNFNFIMNSRWKVRFAPYNYINQLIRQNPFFFVISLLGLIISTTQIWRREEIRNGNFAAILPIYMLLAGLFIMPVPYRQYYMLFLPLLAICCGYVFGKLANLNIRRLFPGLREIWMPLELTGIAALIMGVLSVVMFHVLNFSKPSVLGSADLYLLLWVVLLVFSTIAFVLNRSAYAVLLISIGIIASPLQQTFDQRKNKNNRQLAAVKFIMDATNPDDAVLDGWSGYGFLRDHAYFYFFLHGEMRAMLTEKQKSHDVIEGLERKQAKVIIYDGSIKALPQKVQDYIKSNYKPAGHGNIQIRK